MRDITYYIAMAILGSMSLGSFFTFLFAPSFLSIALAVLWPCFMILTHSYQKKFEAMEKAEAHYTDAASAFKAAVLDKEPK